MRVENLGNKSMQVFEILFPIISYNFCSIGVNIFVKLLFCFNKENP